MKLPKETRPSTATIRSRVVLEIASELVARRDQPFSQAKVLLRPAKNDKVWRLGLFGTGTTEGIEEVVCGESHLAMANPAESLALAYRGTGMFDKPLPVRVITVIPSHDQCLFGVRSDIGINHVEEIGEKRIPLVLSLRNELDHYLHPMLDDIFAACGFTVTDIEHWGGKVLRTSPLPNFDGPRFAAFHAGEINAIFDESISNWCNEAPTAGMTILQMRDETVSKLEKIGYRRSVVRKMEYPNLSADILTLDFSGWPIFVRDDAPDYLVTQICEALMARAALIPWQGPGPLPIERMCREAPDTPQMVPLHPAAERYWSRLGYID